VNVKKWCFSTAREKVNLTEEGIPVPGGIVAAGGESEARIGIQKKGVSNWRMPILPEPKVQSRRIMLRLSGTLSNAERAPDRVWTTR
jgi:hypothetical protein